MGGIRGWPGVDVFLHPRVRLNRDLNVKSDLREQFYTRPAYSHME